MQNRLHHTGDDELLVILLDAPNRWLIRDGCKETPTLTLRHALCRAHELSVQSHGAFFGYIVKQPDDEVVVEIEQIHRLWKYLDLQMPHSSVQADSSKAFLRLQRAQ